MCLKRCLVKVAIYKQRVRSWDEAQWHQFWSLNLKPLLALWPCPPLASFALKNSQLYNLHSIMMNVLCYPLMVAAIGNPRYWIGIGASLGAQEILGLILNYGKLPKSLRNDLWTLITHPVYRVI